MQLSCRTLIKQSFVRCVCFELVLLTELTRCWSLPFAFRDQASLSAVQCPSLLKTVYIWYMLVGHRQCRSSKIQDYKC